ncbi:MAG: transposase [Sphaerochaeta sp.]|nr:transposase [Sphaerochaeta sp.]
MARPRRNDNRIYLHLRRNGTRFYASSNEAVEKDGIRRFRITDWGSVKDGNIFVPGRRFVYAKDRWDDFVFPPEWDISAVDELKAKYRPGRPAYRKEDRSLLYGSVWFLTEIAGKTGIIEDLQAVFGGNQDMVRDVLTLAFFPLLSGKSYNHLSQWQRIERMPSDSPIESRDVTLLTQAITERNRMDLFSRRLSRIDRSHVLCVDSTSKSTYGRSLADIRWGRNKDGLALRQTNEAVVYTLQGHMPVCYQEFPGNIPDMRTVEEISLMLEHAGCPSATWLTDRGYPTQAVLDFLLRKGVPFICCVKAGSSIVSGIIDSLKAGKATMGINPASGEYEFQQDVRYFYEGKGGAGKLAADLRACISYDKVRAAVQERDMDIALKEQSLELGDLKAQGVAFANPKDIQDDCPLYDITFTPEGRILSFSEDRRKTEGKRRTFGYIALLTNRVDMDAAEAWDTYRLRDEQEKYFADMKGAMLDDRNPAWSEKGKEGRMFVHFVGLSVYSYVKDVWKRLGLKDQFPTVGSVIDEMKSIRCIEHTGKARIVTPFVGSQLKICEYYKLDVPEGCAPKVKKVNFRTGRRKGKADQN